MLYWMCKKSGGLPLTWLQMKHAILRNFGGLKSEDWEPLHEFERRLNLPVEELNEEDYEEKVIILRTCTRDKVIGCIIIVSTKITIIS